jgi:hypothetical protein
MWLFFASMLYFVCCIPPQFHLADINSGVICYLNEVISNKRMFSNKIINLLKINLFYEDYLITFNFCFILVQMFDFACV